MKHKGDTFVYMAVVLFLVRLAVRVGLTIHPALVAHVLISIDLQ